MKDYHCLNPILRFLPKRDYRQDIFRLSDNDNCFIYHSIPDYENGKEYFLNVKKIIALNGEDFYITLINVLRNNGDVVSEVPCRKCINCRLKNANEWRIRNCFELEANNGNAVFLTLTYDNDSIVYSKTGVATLFYEDVQYFFKRLRKIFKEREIRFYLSEEYGSHTLRPHYHIILYGITKNDLKCEFYKFQNNNILYTSKIISSIWYRHNDKTRKCLGFNVIGDVNEQSISYVSKYATKILCFDNFEKMGIKKQRNMMSRKRGIGFNKFEKDFEKIYLYDKMIIKTSSGASAIKPIKFFDRQYEKIKNDDFILLKERRINNYDFLEWYKEQNKNTNMNLAEYMNNLENFTRRKFLRKEVI